MKRPSSTDDVGASEEDELDPRVQRFLRFMVETAVRSLLREQEEEEQRLPEHHVESDREEK
jgi:hypothetical protein